jgi:hypothetical protein
MYSSPQDHVMVSWSGDQILGVQKRGKRCPEGAHDSVPDCLDLTATVFFYQAPGLAKVSLDYFHPLGVAKLMIQAC